VNNSRPKAKLSRALGIPLTQKTVKYFEKRPFPPGVHGRSRRKTSDYQVRLLEKQRLRHQYNISEAQMRQAYDNAHRGEGKTGHFMVEGKKVDRPSFRLKPGQVVEVRQRSREKPPFQIAATGAHLDGPSAPYLSTAVEELRTTLLRNPERKEIPVLCDEQLVVEFYAR
jgi:small subunit ribosomal protein S4